nr:hypothetical protein [Tanacetum cinerariifolium]
MFGSCEALATPRPKALPCARFLLFPGLEFPLIASTGFGRFPPAMVSQFVLGQFLLKWLGSPHSNQVSLGLSLAVLPVQYRSKVPSSSLSLVPIILSLVHVLIIRPPSASSIFLLLEKSILDTIGGQTVGHTYSTLDCSRVRVVGSVSAWSSRHNSTI